ncbi:hypothetical protein [Rhodococcus spelaei]|uniref:hypothetical protein n=1 Tax=Rhodococcus spelaei TaxID=2546320 RepID=UPI0015EE8370|nr:hypothetical protein [Rhodococcus spelaei]
MNAAATGLRVSLAGAVAVGGYVHADLYLNHGYRYVHVIGPSFLLQAAVSFAVAVLVLLGGPWWLRAVAALLSAGALAALALSRSVGLFGFTERGWEPSPQVAISVVAEVATLALCAVELTRARRRHIKRPSPRRSGMSSDSSGAVRQQL